MRLTVTLFFPALAILLRRSRLLIVLLSLLSILSSWAVASITYHGIGRSILPLAYALPAICVLIVWMSSLYYKTILPIPVEELGKLVADSRMTLSLLLSLFAVLLILVAGVSTLAGMILVDSRYFLLALGFALSLTRLILFMIIIIVIGYNLKWSLFIHTIEITAISLYLLVDSWKYLHTSRATLSPLNSEVETIITAAVLLVLFGSSALPLAGRKTVLGAIGLVFVIGAIYDIVNLDSDVAFLRYLWFLRVGNNPIAGVAILTTLLTVALTLHIYKLEAVSGR
jgi:hypothetical protein